MLGAAILLRAESGREVIARLVSAFYHPALSVPSRQTIYYYVYPLSEARSSRSLVRGVVQTQEVCVGQKKQRSTFILKTTPFRGKRLITWLHSLHQVDMIRFPG